MVQLDWAIFYIKVNKMNDKQIIEDFLQCKPVDDIEIRAAISRLRFSNHLMQTAISNKSLSKHTYSGKLTEQIKMEVVCSCGDVIHIHETRKVPWTVMKDFLSLVQEQSKIKDD